MYCNLRTYIPIIMFCILLKRGVFVKILNVKPDPCYFMIMNNLYLTYYHNFRVR